VYDLGKLFSIAETNSQRSKDSFTFDTSTQVLTSLSIVLTLLSHQARTIIEAADRATNGKIFFIIKNK
jgi:hypothetical protein